MDVDVFEQVCVSLDGCEQHVTAMGMPYTSLKISNTKVTCKIGARKIGARQIGARQIDARKIGA